MSSPAHHGFDPERSAGRLAPVGAAVAIVGGCVGGWVGWLLAAAGAGLLFLSCWSRDDGLLLVGPFVRAELVRAARTRRLALWRAVYALAAFALLALVLLPALTRDRGANLPALAEVFFLTFASVQLCYLVYLTAATVAPVVAEEREARRWDFLLVTDLRAREILFGKLVGRVPMLLDPVLASLPVLALATLFGGVSPRVVAVAAVGTVACVAGTAGVALFYSVFAATAKAATDGAMGLVLLYLLGPGALLLFAQSPAVWTFPTSLGVPSPVEVGDLMRALNVGNPFGVVAFAFFDAASGAGSFEPLLTQGVLRLAAFHLGVFLVFGLLASARLRTAVPWLGVPKSTARTDAEPAPPAKSADESTAPVKEAKPRRRKPKPPVARPPVGEWPVYWWERYGNKTGHSLSEQVAPSVRRYARTGLWAAGFYLLVRAADPLHPWWAGSLVPMAQGLTAVALVIFSAGLIVTPSILAANSVAKERSADTLDGLRLTSLESRDILFQKWLGCVATALPAYYLAVTLCAAATVTGFAAPLSVVGVGLVTPVYMAAGAAVGLLFSSSAATPAAAVRAMMLTVTAAVLVLLLVGVNVTTRQPEVAVTLALPPLAIGTFFALFADFDGPSADSMARALLGVVFGVVLYGGVGWLAWRAAVRRFDRDRHN